MAMQGRWLQPVAVLVVAALALVFAGCRDDGVRTGDDGRVQVILWHSMVSPLSGSLQRIADEFNESQSEYRVEAIFQGSYGESLNKLIASLGARNIPALIQLDDVSTQIMIDSSEITPIQTFIDSEGYDLSDFDPKALSYYRQRDTLYAMPFNLAGPILYYDRFAFEEVGLDPNRPPRTLDEVREFSERLVVREGGEVTRAGISLQISGWIFEEMLAKQGALYVDGGNGRQSRATEALFAGEEGLAIIEWWDAMIDDGLALNSGTDGTGAMLAVAQGKAAMTIQSTAALGAVVALLAITGEDPARLGTGPLPAPESDGGGIVIGGAALWVLRDRPEEEQQGAWEFLKFAAQAEQQATWHVETGYFVSRLSAYELPNAIQRREQFPQFETAVQQLRESPDTPATQGALVGPFKAVRDRVTDAFELVLGGNGDPATELAAAAEDATEIIREYNRTAPDP